jgi:Fe-S-cluster containining protein
VWREAWESACADIDQEFARNRRLHGDRIQCRSGCSDCCHQLFQITEIEAAVISREMAELPEDLRQRLRDRSRPYLAARRQLIAAQGEQEAWGQLPPPGSRLACPALEDGACTIYEHRPLICRKFGIPLWNPDRPGRVYACALNFRDGDEIHDGQLIQIQTGIHQRWKDAQSAYNAQGGYRDGEPITVARAILEDFHRRVDSKE